MATFTDFPSTDALNRALAEQIVAILHRAIEKNGQASLVVSGGRTPLGLFNELTQCSLSWDKVYITLADERWVAADDASSNEKLVRDHLLQGQAANAHFIGLKNTSTTPFDGAVETEKALSVMPRPFDVVILGMGDDGHTASLFPGAKNLLPALDLNSGRVCMGMTPLTAPLDRMTLTLPALLNSQNIYLHLVGESKQQVYQKASSGTDVNEMPIRAVLNQTQVPVQVFWTA